MSPEVSFDHFADLQQPQDVTLSPDGRWAVYSLRAARTRPIEYMKSSLWIAEVGKKHSSRKLTPGTFNDQQPSFSPDGNYIAFLSDRAKPGEASDIYLLSRQGGEAFQLTPPKDEKAIALYKFSPDGSQIAYLKPAEDSDGRKERLKNKDDAKVDDENCDFNKIHVVSVESKGVLVLQTGDSHVSQLAWSPDGNQIAYSCHSGSDFDSVYFSIASLAIIDAKGGGGYSVLSEHAAFDGLSWYGDGLRWIQRIDAAQLCSATAVFGTDPIKDSKSVHLAQGQIDCAGDLQNCSGKAVVRIVHGMTDQLQIVGSPSLLRQDPCRYQSWDVNFLEGRNTIILVKGSAVLPPEIFSIVDGNECQLSSHGKDLAELALGTVEIVEYENEDGTPMDGFYCIPARLNAEFEGGKPLPTVVIAHGGPYGNSNNEFFIDMFAPAWYASLGFLVLVVNYRGGQGHGNDYAMTVTGDPTASYQDVIWLVKKGIEEKRIDPDRVAMTGWSQGGFLSYLSVTRDENFHFAAAIPGAGVTDWTTMAMTSDIVKFETTLAGGIPWLEDITWTRDRRSSPIYHMKNIKTPMLLLHGEADPRVPVSQTIAFNHGMKARKLDCQMVIYPREDHGFPSGFERAHYIDMMQRVSNFLTKHLARS